MDEQFVREQIAMLREEIATTEDKHRSLLTILDGYENWLRAHKLPVDSEPAPPKLTSRRGSGSPVGEISFRQAVAQTLRNEPGRALEAHIIWHRVQEMGAETTAKDPSRVIDALCYSLAKDGYPLTKVGPMTWQWEAQRAVVEAIDATARPVLPEAEVNAP